MRKRGTNLFFTILMKKLSDENYSGITSSYNLRPEETLKIGFPYGQQYTYNGTRIEKCKVRGHLTFVSDFFFNVT